MSNTRFEVTRPRVSERWRLFRTAETNVRQTLIGERCTIVRLDPVEVHPDREYPRQPTEACLTRDGIELWRRTDSPPGANNGSPMEMLEASSLSRQSIPEADVRPPPHMLNLQYWMDAAAKLQRPSTGARMSPATPDHIVCFEESSPPSAARLEERYNGAWSYQDRGAPNGQGLVSIVGRGLQFLLVTDDGGEPWNIMLSIWQVSDDHQIEWPLSERSSTILGERCFWPNPEDEILIPGASHPTACRTRDGVVLQRNWSGTRNSPASSLTATRVQRGALPADAFMPPPGAFDWIDP
ncbi:MAG TPA: hypothetical protein VM915_00885 [Verrucomicrobiae bacterium]|nr:hypothetical protein [Verrucomicrobiae bacterium]